MKPGGFADRPILVFWETTKACPLACRHCRAHAQTTGAPGELTTQEGERLLADIAGFGSPGPILVVTGGDPLARPDILHLIEHARGLGVRVALAPAVSPALDRPAMKRLRDLGVRAVSISLDGASAATHEGVRGVEGHFPRTLQTLADLVDLGFMVQVNTTVMPANARELADVAALLVRLRVNVWEVFFLVQVGRGSGVDEVGPAECEDVSHFLFESSRYGLIVRTVEGPFFRRVVAVRTRDAEAGGHPADRYGLGSLYRHLSARLVDRCGPPPGPPRATTAGTGDGKGLLFISHDGEIHPAGFLPLALGNVRRDSVVAAYRDHPVLRAIRAGALHGRCGVCEYRDLCGGSRSRAFAGSGDPLGEDPACAYVPAGAPAD